MIKTCKVQKFEGGGKKKEEVKEEDTVCLNSDKFKVIYKHQKSFVQEVEGILLVPKKLPDLLPVNDKEPDLEAFLEIVALGRVYNLWLSKPPA